MGKGEIARYEQFLLFPQCFQKACFQGRQKVSLSGNGLTSDFSFSHIVFSFGHIIASPFVHIFDIMSLFAAELEEAKIRISGKGLTHFHTMTPFDAPGKQAF